MLWPKWHFFFSREYIFSGEGWCFGYGGFYEITVRVVEVEILGTGYGGALAETAEDNAAGEFFYLSN